MNDRKYVFHFRPKPKPKLEKHLALGRIPKPKVQIYVKIASFFPTISVFQDGLGFLIHFWQLIFASTLASEIVHY